ncbi:ABC transporter ATP-binding protein [Bacillus sp. B15-48]|uniref:ABC transporter ATP-binding protein n=1 Tax=Bacillus sp. B15-48 TaxID=1548601 RepID=UPI0019401A50|nr:ABC transporter ATP-binding protein [Bacillus sp. B15-48]MBM4765177.1 ATP-binding cassette domain-containing protein [Bacillus sp. B15-48]
MEFLKVTDLTKKYKDHEAVKQVSFSVQKGESFGLLGPNGAGKTTTIQMVTGLFPPTSGQITIAGMDVRKYPKKTQGLIGVVPQEIALYQDMSALENLKFWGRMYGLGGVQLKTRVEEALELIGLSDRSNEKVATFSGGMKRRVNIAAAILHRPELLIMDEPTVGIDPQSRTHILDTVKRLNEEGMTVIYTSHYMEEVEYVCKRIGIMDHGLFIAEGTLSELRERIGDRSRIILSFSHDHSQLSTTFQIPSVEKEDIQWKEQQLTVFHKNPQLILSDLVKQVTNAGVEVKSVEIVEPNLESVFLHLTGRSLRD